MNRVFCSVLIAVLVLPQSGLAGPEDVVWDGSPHSEISSRVSPVVGTQGMVVADDRIAAEWGAEILRQGGNAVDAIVATAFAMSVTRSHHSSLGGGGFLVYCPKSVNHVPSPCQTIDYREEAPAKATRDMYVKDGKPRMDLSQNGALASGVPGVTSGLLLALEKFGSLPRAKLLTRPIELARKGYRFTGHQEAAASERWKQMNPEAQRVLGCGSQSPCHAGQLIKQPELAQTLTAISQKGAKGFYEGPVAKKLVSEMTAAGGILTLEDLKNYRPKLRDPVHGKYHGMEVVSMPPPSSGGAILLQLFGYADRADAQNALSDGIGSARTIHALAHGMALSFADRAQHFGDPDQVKVPLDTLLSSTYLDSRWASFSPDHAALPAAAGKIAPKEGNHTTNFCAIDKEGNAVVITTTINDNFGSGFMPAGTGVMMNNEMDDFSVQPGVPNLFGLVGTEANSIAPLKRPLSSMSPTIVRDLEGNARILIGAAGGPRIITSVFLSLVNRLKFNLSITDAVAAPRFHQQWRPAEIKLETGSFSPETRAGLTKLGYTYSEAPGLARVHALERFSSGRVWGAPDTRAEGAAVAE